MEIAIIGGGASGILAAITAARNGGQVTIFERLDRIGKKILATGNGRCNYTNINADINNYHGENPEFISGVKNKFWVSQTQEFFYELGMLTKVEDMGKAYPYSLQASSVLDVLRFEIERLGILVVTDFEVESIKKEENRFKIKSYKGQVRYSDKVIVATGGKASPFLGSNGSGYEIAKAFGHKITPLYPSLVQIKTKTDLIKALKGVKIDANVILKTNDGEYKSSGEVLFTDYGLSGPAIFNISGYCSKMAKNSKIILDLLPLIDYNELEDILLKRRKTNRNLENFFVGMLNKKIGIVIMKYANILPLSRLSDTLSDKEIKALCSSLKNFSIDVLGTMSWNNAQVTSGGILTKDIDKDTLESKLCKGLYFSGEILDIDGDCGGFNLQWAWSSGYVAGMSAQGEENA